MAADVCATGFDQMIKIVRNCQTSRMLRGEKTETSGASIIRHRSFLPIPVAVCLHFDRSDNIRRRTA
jgi:hypothetical protein